MPYTTPTPSTVSAGDTFPASAYNIISADLQDHETRIKTGVESYTTSARNALAGVSTGTLIYNSDTNLAQFQVYQGAALGWGVLLPPGMIAPYVGAAAPGGWLLCDGSQVSQTTYAALYAAIGVNKFGTDTGGNFYLPDLRGRVPVGQAPAAAGGNADVQTIGNTEGAAIGSRRPKHLHSTSVSETTTGNQSYASIVNNTNFASGSGIAQRAIVNTSQAGGISGYEGLNSFNTSPNHTHSVGVTVGPQSNSPTDGPAYITLGFIIKF